MHKYKDLLDSKTQLLNLVLATGRLKLLTHQLEAE
jgi:hypothetical protein